MSGRPSYRDLSKVSDGYKGDGGQPCKSDPELFFSHADADKAEAKGICEGCHLIEQCLTWAVEANEQWGIWAGVDFGSVRERADARRGLKTEGGRVPAGLPQQIRELWNKRYSDLAIAQETGLHPRTIAAHRARMGLAPLYGPRGKRLVTT